MQKGGSIAHGVLTNTPWINKAAAPLKKAFAPGLRNKGNTCFLNAVLQSLSSVGAFHVFLRSTPLPDSKDAPLIAALRQKLAALSKRYDDPVVLEPSPVTEVSSLKKRFLNTEQQDAHELLQYVLSLVNDEQAKLLDKKRAGTMLLTAFLEKKEPSSSFSVGRFGVAPLQQNEEQTTNPFTGTLRSTLQCNGCKNVSVTLQRFADLSLSLKTPQGSLTRLEDCLGAFTANEYLEGIECSKCKKHHRAIKRLSIAKAPQGLCLHIRRLVGTYEKLRTRMDFPTHLDLTPYTSTAHDSPSSPAPPPPQHNYRVDSVSSSATSIGHLPPNLGELFNDYLLDADEIAKMKLKEKSTSTISSFLYQLVSVIVHHGNHAGGHYTVYRRLFPPSISEDYKKAVTNGMKVKEGETKEWVHISDEKCEAVRLDEVMNSQAYMLFYERVS